ncbi:MAG: AI-2E family transporter [Pirellulales bacterium]
MSPNDWQRAVIAAAYVFIGVVVVGAMYWAQAVMIPVALAMLLTLVLSPLVQALQRLHIGRAPAVILVVALTCSLVVGVGWLMTRQFVELAAELPAYSDTINTKIRSVRQMIAGPTSGKFGKFISDVTQTLTEPHPTTEREPSKLATEEASAETEHVEQAAEEAAKEAMPRPAPIMVQSEVPGWLGQLTAALGSVGESLATFALAVVLTIFMLLNRESMRDRLIRLIGHGHMTATTKAFDEAIHRISRFLLMQMVVNGTYGLALSVGLMLLGVHYALLWGLLAAVLRYIPYLGAWIAAIPPVLISMAMTDGWSHPLMVVGWIVVLELVSNNIMEPLLYGHSIGVSAVALLVAAAFWAFLWGPVGLVLSSPLTVCLVVLGKYVPRLGFIDILLGDKPALEPHQSFYQRLLARDSDEARHIALAQVRSGPAQEVFDRLIVPALSYFRRDLDHNDLTERDEQSILRAVREIVDELSEHLQADADKAALPSADEEAPPRRVRLLLCAAEGKVDELALELLRHTIDGKRWDVLAAGDDMLAAELVAAVVDEQVPVVCIASIPPGGLAHTRYLCKRLRSYHSAVKILVGRWGSHGDPKLIDEQLRDAGADMVDHTLLETCKHLDSWWNVLVSTGETEQAATAEPVRDAASAAKG